MADLVLLDYVLDNGLEVLDDEATHIYVCNGEPTDFADATTNVGSGGKALGNKNFGAGAVFNSPAAGSALDAPALKRLAGGAYRLISIDGGHSAKTTAHDLAIAVEALAPGGRHYP
jgi:Methyltransferase domain